MNNESLVIIQQWPLRGELALSSAESAVPSNYIGPCAVELDCEKVVVFPNYDEAASAARLAVNLQIGGYSSAIVVAAKPGQQITHNTGHDWAFELPEPIKP